MATTCTECGHRTNEVKSGGGFAENGMRITLKLENQLDLSRDVLKSETCNLSIPELELEVGMGIIGGRFTTVEGLLTAVKEEVRKALLSTGNRAFEFSSSKKNQASFSLGLNVIRNLFSSSSNTVDLLWATVLMKSNVKQ